MKRKNADNGLAAMKYIALTIAGILLYRAASAAAYAQRGYRAIGGEIFCLALPLVFWLLETTVGDIIRTVRETRRSRKSPYNQRVTALMAVTVILILILAAVIGAASAKPGTDAETAYQPPAATAQPQQLTAAAPEEKPQIAESGAEEAGFTEYQIPESYAREGGSFPRDVQLHAYRESKQRGVDFAIVVAAVETESGYQNESIGSDGDTGYLQIIRAYHANRMERLGVTGLSDPYQNITVGIDYMAELLEQYDGNYAKALTAYNCGPTGAFKYYFSRGMDASAYALTVLERAERIRAELANQGEAVE